MLLQIYVNEFVQNSLGCNMGMFIFDLRGYGQKHLISVHTIFGSSHSAISAYQEISSIITFSLHISNSRTKPAGLDF